MQRKYITMNARPQATSLRILMNLAVPVCTALMLAGCVGMSYVARSEGIAFDYTALQAPYLASGFGFASVGPKDPGNKVMFEDKSQLSSNCYQEDMVSVMPAFIVPLPPLIPLFPSRAQLPAHIVFSFTNAPQVEAFKLSVDTEELAPTEVKDGQVRFDLACAALQDKAAAVTFHFANGARHQIPLQYKKAHAFGFFWLGS